MNNKHPLTIYRNEHGISQQEFASAVGVTRWTINRLECRERTPSMKLAYRIVEKTGGAVSADDFLIGGEQVTA